MITIENLTKYYGSEDNKIKALDNVNMSVGRGEFVSIVGESGSGKSTLLTVLGTMSTPTSGKVIFNGIDISQLDSEERADFRSDEIGFVFQNFHLVPYLTLKENVMIPLVLKKLNNIEKQEMALEALNNVGIFDKADRKPSEVSGGEMERAALARATVTKPSILLADEPTGNLDSVTSKRVMDLISKFNHDGMTVFMVTHSDTCAKRSGRIVTMKDGKIL